MMLPDAFATGGVFNASLGNQPAGVGNPAIPQKRIITGLHFSLRDLNTGLAVRRQAHAVCQQYRVTSALEEFLAHGTAVQTPRALQAELEVLRQAVPRAHQILGDVKARTDAFAATVEELNGTQVRVNELEGLLATVQTQLDGSPPEARPQNLSVPGLLGMHSLLDRDVETAAVGLRKASVWDVDLRAGYDHIFAGTEALPLLATATVTYRFGGLQQHRAELAAGLGRQLWLQQDPVGLAVRSRELIRRLVALQNVERGRLRQTEVLLADLETRAHAVEGMQSQKIQSYLDYWWFEITKQRAEAAYLRQHLIDLGEMVGTKGPAQP